MKKVISVLLVLAMACALFIVPAHAHEAEEASARAMLCDDPGGCNQPMEYRTASRNKYFSVDGCTNNALTHNHYVKVVVRYYVCTNSNCSYYLDPVDETIISTSSTEYCIYG